MKWLFEVATPFTIGGLISIAMMFPATVGVVAITIAGPIQATGETKAVITGPSEAHPGVMFVLDSSESVGDNMKWLPPVEVGSNNIQCGERFGTAIVKPGDYEFILIVADTDARIDVARHTVVIRGKAPVPDEPDPDKPAPDKPVPGLDELRDLSYQRAKAVGDKKTAEAISAELTRQIGLLAGKERDAAKTEISAAVDSVLLARSGESKLKDWSVWRSAVNSWFLANNVESTVVYLKGIGFVASGLNLYATEPAKSVASSPVDLFFYTGRNCSACVRWEREVLPHMSSMGFRVIKIDSHSEPDIPTFRVGNKRVVGYLTRSEIALHFERT